MNDQAYCCGGVAANATRMYDLSDNTWTSKADMLYARDGVWHDGSATGASAWQDGYVFISRISSDTKTVE